MLKREASALLLTLFGGLLSAIGLWVFVFPFDFVPSGVDGISIMLGELTGFNAGYFNLLINACLLVVAFFTINKRYVIYTLFFTFTSSSLCILFEKLSFYQYENPSNSLVAALFAGIIGGVSIGIMLRLRASSGGIDIIASIIQRKAKHLRFERITSTIGYIIVAISILIYRDLNCILLSAVQIFSCELTIKAILKDTRNAVEFKIVAKDVEALREDIFKSINHSGTVLEGKGLYSGDGKRMLLVVVGIRQVKDMLNILKKYPDTFVYYSDVIGVHGYFYRQRFQK